MECAKFVCPRPGNRYQGISRGERLYFQPSIKPPSYPAIAIVMVLAPEVAKVGQPGNIMPALQFPGYRVNGHRGRGADYSVYTFPPDYLIASLNSKGFPTFIRIRIVNNFPSES